MNKDKIEKLLEAIENNPRDTNLRFDLISLYIDLKEYNQAEREFQKVLEMEPHNFFAKIGLARCYFLQNKFSTTIVVLEDLLIQYPDNIEVMELQIRAFAKENNYNEAIELYKKLQVLFPHYENRDMDLLLKLPSNNLMDNDDEFSDSFLDDYNFLEKPDIKFSDVGGMENVKKEIDFKIIQPLLQPDLYKAYGKKIGGGILLYGPPGCGKTYIAKATAGEINAKFINVSLNDILDMWVGNSEKNLHEIFETARRNTPCVLFFDEIDALGASRSDMRQSAGRHLINQFLQELDGIENNNEGILVLGATNTPWHLDPAFRRPGRFDRIIFIPPPDAESRASILKLKLQGKPIENIDYNQLSSKIPEFSGADINALIDVSIERKMELAMQTKKIEPITTKDLIESSRSIQASTKEWFQSAKNFALYSNESGLYDGILQYLNIKK